MPAVVGLFLASLVVDFARDRPVGIVALVPAWWQDNVLVYLPGAASDAIASSHLEGVPEGLHPAVATFVVIAWLALFLAGAWAALERRDA